MEKGGRQPVISSMEDLVRERCRAPQGKERALNRVRESARPVKASDCPAGRFQHLPAAARNARNAEQAALEDVSQKGKDYRTRSAEPSVGLRSADVPEHGQHS
jgi:hypothetical protein